MEKPAIEGGDFVRSRSDYLVFGKPDIKEDEINEVIDTLRSGWIGTGPKVIKFENMFKEYIGSKYAIAVNSCTAALHLSMLVSNIKQGDEVITTPLTFASTANSIIHLGAKPVFVDVDRKTMNIDPSLIEDAITPKTKAIIPVHLAGRPCEMNQIMKIAKQHNLLVVDDAAHAIESRYKGKNVGNIADLTSFSFYVTKNIITGEGGMVTTNDLEKAELIKRYALHGLSSDAWKRYSDEGHKHYLVVWPGYKYNMTDMQASLGIHQLKRVEYNLKRREEIWSRYDESFKDLPFILPGKIEDDTRHARHLYTLLVDLDKIRINRDQFIEALHYENIGAGIHFISLHLHPYYKETYCYKKEDFPNAAFISDRTFSIPLSPKLTDKDVDDVIKAIKKISNYYQR